MLARLSLSQIKTGPGFKPQDGEANFSGVAMYKHLLVPLDDTALSSANIITAVELASRLDARITFFHATPDYSATGEGSLIMTLEPTMFVEAAMGDTNVLLSKAVTCANAAKVSCASAAVISDKPAEAIIEAALGHGCDLIVMASHGKGRGALAGWLHSTRTERVLRQSPVALLVTRVEAARPITDAERALAIIQDEHRSIAVVVQSMRDLVNEAQLAKREPDFNSLTRMLSYLREFPSQLHHPKEEMHLHRLLRLRDPGSDALLLDVESQHLTEHKLIDRVSFCLALQDIAAEDGDEALADAVNRLAAHVLGHIGLEERSVLPLARLHLQAPDWTEIATAFAANDDPRFGDLPTEEFRRLFTRIANRVADTKLSN